MQNRVPSPVLVQIVPVTVPADPAAVAARAETVRRMVELGQLDCADDGEVGTGRRGWLARIGGAEFPLVTYSVEPGGEGSTALVSLMVGADAVQVGDPSTGDPAPPVRPATPERRQPGIWGQPATDPRDAIPGWVPEPSLAQQIADNAAPAAQA